MRRTRAIAAGLGALALGTMVSACGLGPGSSPSSVSLNVTRDFGAHRVMSPAGRPKVSGRETVMRFLERNATVKTSYSGGFVTSIDGQTQRSGSQPLDWFYYINGVQASEGAAATRLHSGDHVWWDLHDWSQTESIPAVVGAFPEPFLNGLEGKRWPVTVECSQTGGSACMTVVERLRDIGVPAGISGAASGFEPEVLRVIVGPWSALATISNDGQLAEGPRRSGVYARLSAAQGTMTLLDESGRAVRTLRGDAGLVAAVRTEEEAPVWVVTGLDAAGVRLAAQALDRNDLHDHFAVAVTRQATIPVPLSG